MSDRTILDFNPAELPVTILGIIGSPRRGNTEILINEALEGAREVGNVNTRVFSFHKKRFEGCAVTCSSYCAKHGRCALKDDFSDFFDAWLDADGILFGSPVYHMGPPAQVKAAIDRLGKILFTHLFRDFPRFSKVSAAIVQGSSRWGGQEITLQFFVQHFLLMNCLAVSGDMPDSYIGAAGLATSSLDTKSILNDKVAMRTARNVGRRLAEMTRIVKVGIEVLHDQLPKEYYFSKENLGKSTSHYPKEGVYRA
jgi:multimeric flavodoxin WrbA